MKRDFSLDDMRLFCTLAAAGSYRLAAENLAMPVSTLSRRISLLEERLQVRLLHRDAHRLTLTETGRQYIERCAPLVEELSLVSQELYSHQHNERGTIRISAPVDLSQSWLGNILNRFAQQYPQVRLDLTLSNRNIDLPDQAIDLAIRVGQQQSSEWVQRHLLDIPFALYCAHGQPQWRQLHEPQQLDDWPLVVAQPVQQWRLVHAGDQRSCVYLPRANVRVSVDNLQVAARSVAAGLGVALLPWLTAQALCARGELVTVDSPWQGEARPVYMLCRDRANQPRRLQLLIDFIRQDIQQHSPLLSPC